ncbi:hypothetical protein FG386_000333 [Cryptosporidium ryanae]|uniref:uncharacterized protein n=1 Tax=Cryptosporidium ryanae TaxID=515981 RepID=UPI00351A5A37|nr:hypothetical protein FG386_000333 [Cryptosporidium ryanae]
MIEFIKNNISIGNPTAIFICFVLVTLSILFPYICFAELTKKKLKKANKNKRNKNLASSKSKSLEDNDLNLKSSPRLSNKNRGNFKQIPHLDTETSDEECVDYNKTASTLVHSSNYVQGLSYDIDENDLGEWKVVTEKKSKKKDSEKKMNFSESNEIDKNAPRHINKQSKRKKPINKVPGMTD